MSPVAERTRAISVVKLHPDIGAEIRGVDLSRQLDEETLRAIKDAWHRHAVLLFRDQNLGEDDQRQFASHFGPVAKRVPPKPGAPGAADALVWDDMMTISDHVDANGKALGSLARRSSSASKFRRRAVTRSFPACTRLTKTCRPI
jgi:alpha-ketoglutarate-dependent taurine dioxygenase